MKPDLEKIYAVTELVAGLERPTMVAPLRTISGYLGLRVEAEQRIAREAVGEGTCTLYVSRIGSGVFNVRLPS